MFKTAAGSWVYPEFAVLRIGGVPLFTGFMYAAVGSYIARAWRVFDFRFTRHPPVWVVTLLAAAAYVNFFTHHFVVDVRAGLFVASCLVFGRCVIHAAYRKADEVRDLIGEAVVATIAGKRAI